MTLIQTVFSADRVIQVADRRLTWPDGTVADDEYTKLVCWNETFSVAFTGISRVDRRGHKLTSDWIAELICDYVSVERGVEALRRDAEARVARLRWPDKRLAIVVAGFDYRCVPIVAEIANFDTSSGALHDGPQFIARWAHFQLGRRTGAHAIGAPVRGIEQKLLNRYIPRVLLKDEDNGHNRAIKLLVENQRRVHEQNRTVGEDAQAVTISRERGAFMGVMSNLDGTDISAKGTNFVYFDKRGFRHKVFGPLMAQCGQVLDQFTGTAEPNNPDNQSIGFRILKMPAPPKGAAAKSPFASG